MYDSFYLNLFVRNCWYLRGEMIISMFDFKEIWALYILFIWKL